MADYDIGAAFERIQNELLASMMRNMAHHRSLETAEGLKYEQWQAQQLQALNEYIQNNPRRFAGTYRKMNAEIDTAIRAAYKQGRMDEEIRILRAIKKGFKIQRPPQSMQSEFFTVNERALNALLDEVGSSVGNVQTAILRRANDEYRKAQFNAQVYFGSGASTLGQAVDMAAHDMLARGLSCVQYKNGRIVGAADYARMALRTARTRAYLQGEASMRDEWGINTVVVKSRSLACPKCIRWVGKVYYDDQWGHVPVKDKKYPRLSEAINGGLYHPNCKDIHTTYFEGLSEPPKPPSDEEIKESIRQYRAEEKKQYIQRNIDKYRRLEKGSVEPENKSKYTVLRKQWERRKNAVNAVDNYGKSGIIKESGNKSTYNTSAKIPLNRNSADFSKIGSNNFGDAAKERLRQNERIISSNHFETAILYDNNGNMVFSKKGKQDAVNFTKKEISLMKNGVLTHNHPNATTFSPEDINMLRRGNLSEIRACNGQGAYILRRKGNKWDEHIGDLESIKAEYWKAQNDAPALFPMNEGENRIAYIIRLEDEGVRLFAERYGLEFSWEGK